MRVDYDATAFPDGFEAMLGLEKAVRRAGSQRGPTNIAILAQPPRTAERLRVFEELLERMAGARGLPRPRLPPPRLRALL